jgi:hypothetical protein
MILLRRLGRCKIDSERTLKRDAGGDNQRALADIGVLDVTPVLPGSD